MHRLLAHNLGMSNADMSAASETPEPSTTREDAVAILTAAGYDAETLIAKAEAHPRFGINTADGRAMISYTPPTRRLAGEWLVAGSF